MTESNVELYDFQKPTGLSSDEGTLLKMWMKGFATLFKEKWNAIVPSDIDVKYDSDSAYTFSVLKSRMPKPSLGFNVTFSEQKTNSVVVVGQETTLNVVAEMTGDTVENSDDRALSSIEIALFEMFINEFVSALGESWVDQSSLEVNYISVDDLPHRSRAFDPKTIMVSLNFVVTQGENRSDFSWVVPQEEFELLLSRFSHTSPEAPKEYHEALAEKAKELRIRMAVLLGNAELSFNEMTRLSEGDVIILDQKISEPLSVCVEDIEKFKAWPGRRGNKQAVKITESSQD